MDLISRQAAIDALDAVCDRECEYSKQQRSVMCGACRLGSAFDVIDELPSAQPEIVRCRDCKHQEKFFQTDRRRKDGGYYIFGCEFAEGYSHVCLDDDFCSRAERRQDDDNGTD